MAFFTGEIFLYFFSCVTLAWGFSFLFQLPSYFKNRLPPKPFAWPLIGNVPLVFCKEPHKIFLQLAQRYGPVFRLAIGPVGIVCLTKYEILKETLIKQGESFAGRPRLNTLRFMQRRYHGIVMADGEAWKIHRRFALQTLKEFGLGKTIMEEKILIETDQLLTHLKEYADTDKAISVVSFLELCIANIMASLLFGKTFDRGDKEFMKFLHAANESFELSVSFGIAIGEMIPLLFKVPYVKKWIGFDQLHGVDLFISNFLRRQMRECEKRWEHVSNERIEVRDFATAFLKQMRSERSDDYFTEDHWLGVLNDLWVAGIETTTVALNWIFLFLCLHPDVQTRVQQEIDSIIGQDSLPHTTHKNSMPYTQAVLFECLRFANMVPYNIPHRLVDDVQISGYDVPAGTWIEPQICCVLWDPDVFPNPDRFEPGRFLDENGQLKTIEQFIPFSLGKRSCLGERMAKVEMFLITTTMLQKYTFRLEKDKPPPSTLGIMGLTKRPVPYLCHVTSRSL